MPPPLVRLADSVHPARQVPCEQRLCAPRYRVPELPPHRGLCGQDWRLWAVTTGGRSKLLPQDHGRSFFYFSSCTPGARRRCLPSAAATAHPCRLRCRRGCSLSAGCRQSRCRRVFTRRRATSGASGCSSGRSSRTATSRTPACPTAPSWRRSLLGKLPSPINHRADFFVATPPFSAHTHQPASAAHFPPAPTGTGCRGLC